MSDSSASASNETVVAAATAPHTRGATNATAPNDAEEVEPTAAAAPVAAAAAARSSAFVFFDAHDSVKRNDKSRGEYAVLSASGDVVARGEVVFEAHWRAATVRVPLTASEAEIVCASGGGAAVVVRDVWAQETREAIVA